MGKTSTAIKWTKDQSIRPHTGLNFFEALVVHYGGMGNAAIALGLSYQAINNWKARGGVPLASVEMIEKATEGFVHRGLI